MHRIHRSLAIAILGLGLIVIGMVRADAGGPATTKVGYVDLQRTLDKTKLGKKAGKKFERDKKKKEEELEKDGKAFEKKALELQKQASLLQPDVRRKREAELQNEYLELQKKVQQLNMELEQMKAKLLLEVYKKATPHIAEIAQRDGYTIILDANALMWAAPNTDITDELNDRLDKGK